VHKRRRSRELAMKALCQIDVQNPGNCENLQQFFPENEPDDTVKKQAVEWTRGVVRNLTACDELISDAIIKWQLSRLAMVDKSIIRLAVYQLKFCPDIPPKVAINEAIELAKKYSSKQSPHFVNGVLDAAFKKLNRKT